jgi:hypothetical protein
MSALGACDRPSRTVWRNCSTLLGRRILCDGKGRHIFGTKSSQTKRRRRVRPTCQPWGLKRGPVILHPGPLSPDVRLSAGRRPHNRAKTAAAGWEIGGNCTAKHLHFHPGKTYSPYLRWLHARRARGSALCPRASRFALLLCLLRGAIRVRGIEPSPCFLFVAPLPPLRDGVGSTQRNSRDLWIGVPRYDKISCREG